MLNVTLVAPYIITGGLMWFIVYQMAPLGREFTLGRTILGVVWMALCERGANALLRPRIGDWSLLAGFLVSVLVAMFWFDIRFWRAFFAVLLYNAILIGAFLLMEYGAKHLPQPRQELQGAGASLNVERFGRICPARGQGMATDPAVQTVAAEFRNKTV